MAETKKYLSYWQTKRDGEIIAHGPKETFPDAGQRRVFRADGYKIYVEGKLYQEGKKTAQNEK